MYVLDSVDEVEIEDVVLVRLFVDEDIVDVDCTHNPHNSGQLSCKIVEKSHPEGENNLQSSLSDSRQFGNCVIDDIVADVIVQEEDVDVDEVVEDFGSHKPHIRGQAESTKGTPHASTVNKLSPQPRGKSTHKVEVDVEIVEVSDVVVVEELDVDDDDVRVAVEIVDVTILSRADVLRS